MQVRSMSGRDGNSEFVQSLERGLAVIQAFGPDSPEMTISEVAEATGTTRATARRFLLTLEQLGHVRTNGKRFALTPHVLGLGYAYLSSLEWWYTAQPAMEDAVHELQESCSAAVLDGNHVVYVSAFSDGAHLFSAPIEGGGPSVQLSALKTLSASPGAWKGKWGVV